MPFTELEKKLLMRGYEPPSPHLADNIIAAAMRRRQDEPVSIFAQLRGLFADFMLPQPAYALAAILMLGLGIGFTVDDTLSQNDSKLTISALLTDDGTML